MADEQQRRLSLPAVTRALINARGVMSTAASALGVSRSALSAYVSKTAEAAKAYQEARQGLCDMAENRLVEAVEAGDWRATLFVLSTLARDRGYGSSKDDETMANVGPIGDILMICVAPGACLDALDMTKVISQEEARRQWAEANNVTIEGEVVPTPAAPEPAVVRDVDMSNVTKLLPHAPLRGEAAPKG